MVTIFISHDWNRSELYERFKSFLDRELGPGGWTDVSIPQSKAIELQGFDASNLERSLDEIEDRIVYTAACLADPNVPTSLSRTIWDVNGQRREIPTYSELSWRLRSLLAKRVHLTLDEKHAYVRPSEYPEYRDVKYSSPQIRLHPELSLAIRKRIQTADGVFVLVTHYCRYRRWIEFEIRIAADSPAKVMAIEIDGNASRDFSVDSQAIASWDSAELRRLLRELRDQHK
jgi:hypothetical protein